ncbi:MAG TPA: ATP-binding protein [Candidatus Acidoferrales bacterium]|nr:ATP-binding protein [Candidatus Acidoferrales bacterium]
MPEAPSQPPESGSPQPEAAAVPPVPAAPAPELAPEKLRWRCDPESVPFETTSTAPLAEGVIGQDRAIRAIQMGLEVGAPGYNIFVCGLAGSSRGGLISRMIQELEPHTELAPDRCYVNNFKAPDRPRLLTLPRGKAQNFKKDMTAGIDFLRRRIPQVFEGEPFQRQKGRIVERFTVREKELMDDFTRRIAKEQFALGRMQVGAVALPEIFPVLDGQMVPVEELPKLVQEGKLETVLAETIERKYDQFRQEFTVVYRKTLLLSRELASEMSYLEQEAASVLLDGVIEDLKEKYPDPTISEYLEEVRHHILDNLDLFKDREGEESEEPHPPEEVERRPGPERDPYRVYGVNVLLAHTPEETFPVIFETSPTYVNVFGSIHRNYDPRGSWNSDFMDIRPGSMLRADGGFLIMYAMDCLTEVGVWKTLKRTLNHAKLEIQPLEYLFPLGGTVMKPEPIDLTTKIILIGDRQLYELLYTYEEDFRKIFKVRAEFDEEMNMSQDVIPLYGGHLRKLSGDEGLCPFDRTAVAALVEYGVRRAGRRNKITARVNEVLDLAREACYTARQDGDTPVTGAHVRKALQSKIERHALVEEKMREMIAEGLILIDTDGARVGVVNGLSVFEYGGHHFGKPSRITASVSLGKAGLINIEREAGMSGHLHDKGMQIISGYLRGMFAQDKPMSLSGSLCFEQSYSGVDGDSASSTEIYALLSALSGVPLRQDIAVTGSVNQQGEIQCIGGINEKIEGFFDTCRIKGLTGRQGVIMPQENVEDLMLREEVIEAVAKGRFHIWPIKRIEQGIEILTGRRAGGRSPEGKFEEGTVFGVVDNRLREMVKKLKEFE